jgi:hypothetical protein
LKFLHSSAAHRQDTQHTSCSQLGTASTFQSSGNLKVWPPKLLGRLGNDQKWQKNFQTVIYVNVCSAATLAPCARMLRRRALDFFPVRSRSQLRLDRIRRWSAAATSFDDGARRAEVAEGFAGAMSA